MRNLIALIFIVIAANAMAEPCSDSASHADQRACLARAATEIERIVLDTEQAMRDTIAAWDQETTYKESLLKSFNYAAKAFGTYKASICEFEAGSAAGGNGAGDLRLSCSIELNKQYVAHLNSRMRLLHEAQQ